MLSACTDFYIRITDNVSLVTATIDIADGTNGKDSIIFLADLFYSIFVGSVFIMTTVLINVLISRSFFQSLRHLHLTLFHIHIDMWIAYNVSLIATAEDIVNTGCRDDIDTRVSIQTSTRLLNRSISIITINRITCQITTEIQFTDLNRHTAILFNINGDRAIDISTGVVTSEDPIILTITDVQHDITVHVCIL